MSASKPKILLPKTKRWRKKVRPKRVNTPEEFLEGLLSIPLGEAQLPTGVFLASDALVKRLTRTGALSHEEIERRLIILQEIATALQPPLGEDLVPEGVSEITRDVMKLAASVSGLEWHWKEFLDRASRGRMGFPLDSPLHSGNLLETFHLFIEVIWEILTKEPSEDTIRKKREKAQEVCTGPVYRPRSQTNWVLKSLEKGSQVKFIDARDVLQPPCPQKGRINEIGKTIVPRVLPRIGIGDFRILRQKVGMGNAITSGVILIDQSGSMSISWTELNRLLEKTIGMTSVWLWDGTFVTLAAGDGMKWGDPHPHSGGTPNPLALMATLMEMYPGPYYIITDYSWHVNGFGGPPRKWPFRLWRTGMDDRAEDLISINSVMAALFRTTTPDWIDEEFQNKWGDRTSPDIADYKWLTLAALAGWVTLPGASLALIREGTPVEDMVAFGKRVAGDAIERIMNASASYKELAEKIEEFQMNWRGELLALKAKP